MDEARTAFDRPNVPATPADHPAVVLETPSSNGVHPNASETIRDAEVAHIDGHLEATGDVTFIVGPARSGTTALYKALCLHPRAIWISNWTARFPSAPRLAALNRLARAFPDRRMRAWFGPDSNAYVYGRPRPLVDRVFPTPVEGEPVYTASGVAKPGAGETTTSDDAGERLRAVFDSIRAHAGGTRLISKRIANNLRIPFLAEAFPRARFISMIRDGRAVAYSLARVDWWPDNFVWWYGGTPARWQAQGGDPWELCARHWVEELNQIETSLDRLGPDRVLRIRYEEIVSDPVAIVQAASRFVGLPDDDRWTSSLRSLSFANRNDAWRAKLDPAVIARITAIQHGALEAHGYVT